MYWTKGVTSRRSVLSLQPLLYAWVVAQNQQFYSHEPNDQTPGRCMGYVAENSSSQTRFAIHPRNLPENVLRHRGTGFRGPASVSRSLPLHPTIAS